MATRRQKQLERKYSSFRRFTATEDVNYASHSSRSSHRSESVTSRTSARGRSTSSEISTGSETRSLPVYIAIQDYTPEASDLEAVALEQGQIVEVLDNKNAASWLVRTKARPPVSGWVPGSYFETPTEYYKQRRRTRELTSPNLKMTDEQESILKRDQAYHDLLRSEEDFVTDLSSAVDNYVRAFDDPSAPQIIKDRKTELGLNLRELYNFHANVMLKGLQYYSDDPGKVGQTFVRLERDFDHHVQYYRESPKVLQLIANSPEVADYLQKLSDKIEAGARSYEDYLRQIGDRIKQYTDFFKEIIKYSARAQTSTKSMQKALELLQSIPKRAEDVVFTDNIVNYPGEKGRLGRLFRHDLFQVWEGDEPVTDRYIFLFNNKLMITDKDDKPIPPVYNHYATIRLDKYTVRTFTADEDVIFLRPNEPGLPTFRIKAKDLASQEFVRKAWLKDILDMQEVYSAEHPETATSITGTEYDVSLSDVRSEFSEYSTLSRKSSLYNGPEEGPPRKKIKSPPGISPTGSSTSLYSGGSSIDWTTTGTTLEMQGTRVTRTQYGFRTLQESSAKMCLKVTGYPLPDITWYKDDQLLKEDERRTFYADEDGFFAMTIDPVQVTDTGRYTCVATNEYGQASTSAFFRVLKVEKEAAPPAFAFQLKDKEVKEGEVVSFECEVEGWPEPELVWLVDDQPLRPSQDFRLQYDGQNAKLEIRDAQPEDTGVYAVKITNEYGTQESIAKLLVQPDPDKNHVPPEFQAMIEDVECKEGDSVRFKAVITGDPDPEITWLVNGIPLSESEKIKFISEDGICILTIKDVSRHFDGLVTCQGKNRLGTATCDANLRVKVDPAPPTFDKPLEDRVITEKSSVMFECEVSGYPEPTVEFTLNGKPLTNGIDGIEILSRDGNHRVTITDANAEKHDGVIVAKAVNNLGSAESRAKLGVEPPEEESRSAPTFIKDIEDQTVKSGEPASFVTIVRGNPNPHVTWHLNGQKLDDALPGIKIEVNGADHKLSIIDSSKYAGTVLCRAENSIGRFETKARLIVLPTEKRKKAPEFLERLTDKSETEGATAVFEVRVDAEPRATFKWTLNGQELVENDRVHFRDFDGSVKIEIADVKLVQSGALTVTATNSEGSTTSEAKLTVNRKPCVPKVTEKPKNVSIERGQEAVFEATVDGAPFPEVTWSIGGRKIRPTSDGAKVETTPDGKTKIIIDTNKFFENATIAVTVESPQGTDEAGALLNIEEPKRLAVLRDLTSQTVEKDNWAYFETVITNATSVQWLLDGQPLNVGQDGIKISQDDKFEFRLTIDTSKFNVTTSKVAIKASNNVETIEKSTTLSVTQKPKETATPSFTDGLKDITAELGKPLQVDVIALNEPAFEWKLNGQPLVDGKDGVHITTEGNKSTIKIDSVGPEHAGTLSVVAKNEAGSQESSAKIEPIQGKTPAKITSTLSPVTVNEKESVEFSVTVEGTPTPTVAWNLNDQPITGGSVTSGPNGQHSLRLTDVTPAQSGDIKVVVTNELGSAESTTKLTVKPADVKPVFGQTLTDAKVEEGSPLSFTVSIDGPVSPSTKVNWYLNGKKLEPTDGIQLSEDGTGKYTLNIAKTTLDMNGTISVRAENPQGLTESKAKIEISTGERGPEFSKTPADQDVEEQTSIKFSAIVTGIPYPEITWLLNDVEIDSNDEIRVKRDAETGKTSIRIFKPKIDQSGKVKIRAKNKLGSIESTAELKVNRKKEIPNFLNDFMDRQINEGSDVKFQAKIAAYPEPEVTWTLNGQPITADNVKTSSAGDIHTIEFTKVQLNQAGELACEAKNAAGHKKQNCTINVKEAGIAPNFTSNLTDRLVDERETVIMEAVLNKDAKPPATITWFKDGQPLTDSRFKTTFDQSNGILKLTLVSAELTDKCRISVKAENRWGAAESSASIGVTKKHPMAKPQFLSELAPVTITEGDSLETKVIITGDPKPYAKWYINNQMVYQTEDTEIKEVNGVYSLVIHGCSTDMSGTIKCVAGNRMGEATTEGKLTVIAPVPVEFETCLCDATCREGDTLKLKAVLLGEPRPDVTWFVNGKRLEESQNIKIHAEKGTYTVTIKDITCDYSGKVVCEAVNEFGKASSEATLIVMPRGEPPDFIEWLSNIRARQGSSVTHKVVFTGDPKPVLTWFIHNREVKDGLEGITIKTVGNTSTLVIKNFSPEKHVGEIICKAENDAGEVSCTANMATYTSDMVSESESEAMADDVGGTDDLTEIGSDAESVRDEFTRTPTPVMAPKFITKIKDTRASKGHQAVFECVVPDTKGVVCKWLKDGKEIELIARIRVQSRTIEGHITSELIIDDVKPEDAGRYTVVVENAAGTERCEANLNVVDTHVKESAPKAPEFTDKLHDKQVKTGEKVVLECKVDGEPKPNVSWFKDEQKIIEQSQKVTIESTEGLQRLVIEKSETTDTSVYKCVAENASGKSSTEAKLEVRAPGTTPEFTRALVDKAVTLGEKVILECSVRGVPQPVVEFFKGSTRIESGGRFSVQQHASQTHWRLVINQTTEADLGEYRAEARNNVGVAISASQITSSGKVKEPEPIPDLRSPPPVVPKSKPEITQGLKAQKLKEGGLAEMEVTVSGNPQPDVEFFKNGEKIDTSDQRISVEVDQETGKHTLRIRDIVPTDAGEYSARAVSPEGSADSKAPLEVEAALIPAKIVQGLRDIEVNEGDRIELTIKVIANPPASVTWTKNGEPAAMDGEHLIVRRKSDNEFQLILNKVRLDDESVYSAKAVNKLGSDETTAKVKIIEDVSAPSIVEKLKDTEVKEGQTLEVCVTVTGKPTPSVEFFRNGTPINVDGTRIVHKMEGSHHTLIINEAKVDESGRYSAKAVNKAGTAESSSSVTVLEDLQPPVFVDKLRSAEIKESQFSELSVTVTGKPKPSIQWLKDGKPITPDGVHILEKSSPDFNYYSITIKNAIVDDSGVYTARATNKAGTEESSAKFKVQEDLERPVIKSGLISKKIKEGNVVELVVVIGGKPYPDVTWLKNGSPISLGGRITEKVENDGSHTLVISTAELGDTGTFSVAVVNKAGKTTSTCELEVVEDLEPVVIVQKLKSINTTEGQTVEFALVVTGKPYPKVEWFREGKPVVPDDRFVINVDESTGRHTLSIKNAQQSDSSGISIKASNKVYSETSKATLFVGEHTEPPRFSQKLTDLTINENENAVFECVVTGKPIPDVSWFKDGRPVYVDNKRITERIENETGKRVLIVSNTVSSDVGTYSCQAVNKVGASSTKADLKINGIVKKEEPPVKPTFSKQLVTQTVKQGENAVFEAIVDETTKPEIAWFKDGKPVTPTGNVLIEHRPDGTVKLTVINATANDVGVYKVEVFNPAGKISSEATLKYAVQDIVAELVEEVHELPQFVKDVEPQNVQPGDVAVLEAILSPSSDRPVVQWFKDDAPVTPSEHVQIEQTSEGNLKLTVAGATDADAGTYRVVAKTPAGEASSSAPLNYGTETAAPKIPEPTVAPSFTIPLKPQVAKKGETITLECKVDETAQPQIQWFRDSVPVDTKPNVVIEHRPDGTLKLTIRNIKDEDIGTYRCEAINKIGKADTNADLKFARMIALNIAGEEVESDESPVEKVAPESVKFIQDKTTAATERVSNVHAEYVVITDDIESSEGRGVGAPEFVELLRSALTSPGGTATLKCKVKGVPRPSIKWTRNGTDVALSDRVTSSYAEDGTITLTIKDATDVDSGEYRCEATNDFGSAWTEAPVILAAASSLPTDGEAPDFTAPVRPVTVAQGAVGVLEGKIIGTPAPEVKWYKGGKEIAKNDTRYVTEALADGTQRLTVKDAQYVDVGEYRCEATNKWGDVWSDATLTVHAATSEIEGREQIVPTFMQTLQETVAKENEHHEFEVMVGGEPKPEVKWYKDNKPIDASDQHFKQSVDADGKAKLVIAKTEKADAGKFTCEAINEAGKAKTEAPLHVEPAAVKGKPEQAPEFSQGLKNTKVKEGETVEFKCKVNGHPPPTVKWFKDGEELKASDGVKIESREDGTNKLILDKAKVDDQGNYRVEAVSDLGTASSKAPLTVEPAAELKLKRPLQDQQIPSGSKLGLSVEVEGHPKTVKWFKGSNEIQENASTHFEKAIAEEYKLIIDKVELADTAAYRVVLANETQSIESSCQVTVSDATPAFKKGLADQAVPKGAPLRLEIEVDGKPKTVKWYKNGEELKPSDKAKPQDLGNGKYALVIPEVGADDFANYTVKIGNDAGEVESTAKVSEAPSGKPTAGDKPQIVSGLKPQSVKPGDRVVLEVEAAGPVKQVKWYKNGQELPDAQTEEFNGKKFRLIVPSAAASDAGDYKVVLSNDDGTADSSAALTVVLPADAGDKAKKPTEAALKFVKPLEDVTADKGATVPLEFEVSKKPKQVKWYKNGKELMPSDKEKPKQLSDTKYALEVSDVDADGQFKVVVIPESEDEPTVDSSCALIVKLPPKDAGKPIDEAPKFVKGLVDQSVPAGDDVELVVTTSGSPKTIKWYKNGQAVPSSTADRIKAVKIDDNNYKLVIPKSLVDDSGEYAVEIENAAGKAKSTGKITVTEPKLTFVKPLSDVSVTEGEAAEFVIETNSKPKTVKWYKNGQEIRAARGKAVISTIDDTKYSLKLINTEKSDSGEIKVVLSNAAGDVDSTAKLTVSPKSVKAAPTILKGLEDAIAAVGNALVFEVKVDGDVDTFKFLKNGQPIESVNRQAVVETVAPGVYKLTIPSAALTDAGTIAFVASNAGGDAKSSANAEVDEKPSITKALIPASIDEGDDHTFKVEVNAPVRSVKWYKNGQEVKPSAHISPKQISPKKFELTINKAQLDDGATWKVVLGNAAGECDSAAALTVEKPNLLKLLKGLTDVDVNEGEPITLSCKIDGEPKSVKWFKNGKEVVPDESYVISSNPTTGEYTLTIPSAKSSDSAAFRVVFANDRGEIQSGALAHVKPAKKTEAEKAVPAAFVSPLQDTEIEEGDTLTLKAKVAGNPQPEIKWYRNGQEIKPNGANIVTRLAFDGTATLRILDAKKSDAGTYKIVATNPGATVESSCTVGVLLANEVPTKPKFIIPLRSTDAPIGANVEFNFKVRSVPPATLRFQIDGKELPVDGVRVILEDMHDGNFTLIIKDVREEDFGTIRAVAENPLGKDECEAVFDKTGGRHPRARDEEGYPPRFNVPLWDRRVPEGHPMFIECHVDAKPIAEITWTKNGDELKPAQNIQIEYTPEGACRVKITDFNETHVGAYKCFAKNEYGTADTIANLNVEVISEEDLKAKNEYAPKFNPQLEDVILNEGGSLTLSCRVDAIPTAIIQLYKDGLPVKSSDRLKWSYDPSSGRINLTVANVNETDGGAYRAVASNHLGSTNTACLVTVRTSKPSVTKTGEEPFFKRGLTDKYVDRGETLELLCEVIGDPMPEIKWYRNGILLRPTNKITIETTPEGVCKLIVKDTTMSDEGVYRCEATNEHGKAKTQCTAHIELSKKREKTPIFEGEAPKFVQPLEDAVVTLKGLIELDCKVTGLPIPSLKWSKDGSALIEDARFEWTNNPEKGIYSLRIRNATVYDEGTYRAVASNDSGSATSKAMIRIDDGGKVAARPTGPSTAPRIAVRLADVRVFEGSPLKLECKIEGTPAPEIVWYKDGERVNPSERLQLEFNSDTGMARLIVPSATLDDDGLYRVIATNDAGSAVDKCNATVKKSARGINGGPLAGFAPVERFDANRAPKVVVPLDNVRVPEKQPFKLTCKFSGDPKPTIKWYKDGERVYAYGRCQLKELSDGTCELSVDAASRSDGGMYRCVADNDYGSARTTCEVTVQLQDRVKKPIDDQVIEGNAPGFSIPLIVKRARAGETVVFECLPYGKPFPTIKWLKDGLELVPSEKLIIEAAPDGTQRLTVADVDFLSEGYYRCVATNEYGTASTKADLTVSGERRPLITGIEVNGGPPEESKPRIRRGLYPMSIHQGNPVEFQVVATGWPTPTVKWFKNGEELKSDGAEGRTSIWTDERGVHHCVIIDARPDDEADYSLIAVNPLGEARTEGPLSVIRPRHAFENGDANGHATAHPPGFIRQLKNKHVFTHMPTIFDCLVVGTPPPTVDWYHDGKKIVPDGRTKIQVAGGGSHALIILDTKIEDAGEYVAIARNASGTAQSSAILDVTVPHLDNIKFDGSIDVTPYLTEEYGFRKLNYKCLPTPPDRGPFIKEVTGHYLTLSWIPTKRTPPRYPQVTYVIEIRELPEREWTLLDFNIPEPVCKVRNLELGKSYQFRVRAENIYGISDPSPSSPSSRLMAPPRPVLDKNKRVIPLLDPYAEKALEAAYAEQYACAPWFAPGVDDKRFCAESDTITVALSYSGYPDPKIQWKFRGWDIDTTSDTSNIKVSNHGGAETILTISGFSKTNVGQYQCIATNQYGDAQQNVHIDLGERPKFLQPLLDRVFSDGKPMKLDVRVEGSPFPEIKWLKDWRPIAESHRIKFVKDGPYLCSMIVTNPVWRDSGIYSVIAINEAGQATTSCTVTVEADGEYNDVQLPRKKVTLEARKPREIYEIDEADEKKAATGAPFIVKEKKTGKRFIAQLKPVDDSLKRGLAMHNVLDGRSFVQYHQVIADKGMALVVFENADRTHLDDLLAPIRQRDSASPTRNREEEVRIFVKQLLTALQYMHHRNIVHLDLRPEVVILHDDHLKLADFGQSRHLLAGKAKGEIAGSPEFVSPEVARGTTVTLATDMWSAGVLTYVLLSGLSPFLGDNDDETLRNVVAGRFNLSVAELSNVSPEAKDFLTRLMLLDPVQRLSVDQALKHDWLADPALAEARLSTDCLREFKYQHKWLERRVFVQQSPSEQITDLLATPTTSVTSRHPVQNGENVAEPFAIYDYLRIKDSPLPLPEIPDYDPRGRPQRRPSPRQSVSPDLSHYQPLPEHFDPRDPRGRSQPLDFDPRDPRNRDPRAFGGHPPPPHPHPHNGYGPDPRGRPHPPSSHHFDPRNAAIGEHFGGRVPSSDELRALIERELPPGVKLPPGIKPEDLLFVLPPPYGQSMPSAPPTGAQRRSASQGKEAPPKQNGVASKSNEDVTQQIPQPPLRLVRGERRDIEEEIANRILSDISEENSIAGSLASLDDFEPLSKMSMKERNKNRRNRRSRSRSSTPLADGNTEDTLTPVGSPGPTIDSALDPLKQFFGDHVPVVPEFNDPKVPVGAPVFVDGLKHGQIVVEAPPPRATLSPRPRSGTPGTKSPVLLSPGREHKMEVVIATKRGTQDRTSPMHDSAEPLKKKKGHGDDDDDIPRKIAPSLHPDDKDFDDLMNEVERVKQAVKRHTVDDDLDKYRPKHFYKEEEIEPHIPENDVDDYPWESAYQIGPDTLLLATRGPEFNARVRDYRRELWGDGAPFVRQGFLGYRNQDITVRERRRFTDLIREDPVIAKSIKETKQTAEVFQNGAIRRVTTSSVTAVPGATRKNPDGTFGAIFRSRLRDAHFVDHAPQLTLTCAVIGNPEPEISWMHHESTVTDDSNYKIVKDGDVCRLTILRPSLTDLGEYTCVAVNPHGTDRCSARVVTGEAPDRPSRPEVELSSDTEVLLTWEAPEMATCLEGVTYKVECRPAGDGDHCAKWTTISDNVEDEAVVIRHLHVQGIYQFRVTAKNGFGFGIPSLTSRIIRTHPRGVPKLNIDSLRDQMKLSVLSMPQRRGRTDPGLAEISETAEEEASEEELSIASSVVSVHAPPKPLVLSSEAPETRFQLESEIFRGSFSIVRNAVDTSHSVARHVVAKIRVPATNLPAARLAEEFETLRESQHENVVTLLGAYERDNTLFLFTERLYENVFERFTYPDYYNEEQIALTIRQLTSALHWIHFRGVLHLDVQPENVMFATKRSWIVKLIDFEESKFVDSPPPLQKRKPANPEWAAPELLQKGSVPTVQTDVWGMGIICFTLLAGFHPFSDDGETPDEVKEAVCKQKCDPNLIPVQATQEALRFATWAIKKNPARRIRTDEALSHRWLSSEKNMVRRRENVKFPSNRLRRTTLRTFNRPQPNTDNRLESNYGAKH